MNLPGDELPGNEDAGAAGGLGLRELRGSRTQSSSGGAQPGRGVRSIIHPWSHGFGHCGPGETSEIDVLSVVGTERTNGQ
jgi:hypothetical protein